MPRRKHSGITDQRRASIHRMKDAQVLFAGGRWRGAMYLAGYAVECRLKYKLMQKWNCFTLEELEERLASKGISANPFTHNLETLLKNLSGWERLKQNRTVWEEFRTVNEWRPTWRYSPDLGRQDEADDFLAAARDTMTWIENNC